LSYASRYPRKKVDSTRQNEKNSTEAQWCQPKSGKAGHLRITPSALRGCPSPPPREDQNPLRGIGASAMIQLLSS